jgi:hypothetical protein
MSAEGDAPLCPSAQPDMSGAVVLGVVGGTAERPRLGYLAQPQPVTLKLLQLAEPVQPTEVFRFAAPCAEGGCRHFDGARCRLVDKLVARTDRAVDTLPPCRLRPRCRWWAQDGREACLRCPGVVTEDHRAPEALRAAADPSG